MGISFNGNEVTKVTFKASADATAVVVDKLKDYKDATTLWSYAPATPSGGTISGGGDSPGSSTTDSDSLAVSWSINNDNGDDVTSYTIEASTDANFGNGTIVQTQEVSTSDTNGSLTLDGLAPDTVFYFRVKSNGESGSSSWAVIGSSRTAPATPTLTAEVWSATAIKLSWTQPTGTDKVYIDQRTLWTNSTDWNPLVVGSTQNFAIISALTSGREYQFRIIAKNDDDSLWSDWSSPVSATVGSVPTAPAAPTATTNDQDVTLSWTAVTGADEYALYMYDYDQSKYYYLDTATGTSYTHFEVGYGSIRNYKIKAVKNLGGGKVYSDYSYSVTTYTKLATPTLGSETQTTSTSFRAVWNLGANAHYTGAVYHDLQWYGGAGSYNAQDNILLGVAAATYNPSISGLTPDTQYTWRVRAYHPSGLYPPSDWLETTHSTFPAALGEPSVYVDPSYTDVSARIKWMPVDGAINYNVSGGGTLGASGVDSQGFNYQDISGLTGSTPYNFTVEAVAGVGYSGNTAGVVSFTTLSHNISNNTNSSEQGSVYSDVGGGETYLLTSSAVEVIEGNDITFSLATTGVPQGTQVGYMVSNAADEWDGVSTAYPTGYFIVGPDGRDSVTISPKVDQWTEIPEQSPFVLFSPGTPIFIPIYIIDSSEDDDGAYDITASHFKVNWSQPTAQQRDGTTIGPLEGAYFDVVLKKNGAEVYTNLITPSSYPAIIQYNYLDANTDYEVSIIAKKAGYTDSSPRIFNVTTDFGVLAIPIPSGLQATSSSINLTWGNVPEAVSYTVRYRKTGGNWSYKSASTNTYTIENLDSMTQYEVQVQSDNISYPASSGYSSSYYVFTEAGLLPLPTVNIITITNSTLYLNFAGSTGVEFFGDLRTGGYSGTVVESFTIPVVGWEVNKLFSGLNPNTTYYLNLRQRKSGFIDSAYHTLTFYTTKETLGQPTLSGVDNVTETTANIAVTPTDQDMPFAVNTTLRIFVYTNSSLTSLHSTQNFETQGYQVWTGITANGVSHRTVTLTGLSSGTTYWLKAQWLAPNANYLSSNLSSAFSIATDTPQVATPTIPSHNGADGFLNYNPNGSTPRAESHYYRPTSLAHTVTLEVSKDVNNFSIDHVYTFNQNARPAGDKAQLIFSPYSELAGLDVLVRMKAGGVSGFADSEYTSARSWTIPHAAPMPPTLFTPEGEGDTIRVGFPTRPGHNQSFIEVAWHYNSALVSMAKDSVNNYGVWVARLYPNNNTWHSDYSSSKNGVFWAAGTGNNTFALNGNYTNQQLTSWKSYSNRPNAPFGLTKGSYYLEIDGALATDNPWHVSHRLGTIQNNGTINYTSWSSTSTITALSILNPSITVTSVTDTEVFYQGYLPSNNEVWNTYYPSNPNNPPGQFRLIIEKNSVSGWERGKINAEHSGHSDSDSNGSDLNSWLPDFDSDGMFSGSFAFVKGHDILNLELRIAVVWYEPAPFNVYVPTNGTTNNNPPVSNTFSAPSNSVSVSSSSLNQGFPS
jgi:fibronectin type 3 domain-containing protein